MKKWEYCNFDYSEPTSFVHLTLEGEQKVEVGGCGGFLKSKEQKAACTIARLGESGWEAFQMHDELFWFKRPVQDQTKKG